MKPTIAISLLLTACSGSVDVHGVPSEIQLDTPICVPAKTPAPSDAGNDAADSSTDSGTDAAH